MSPWAASLLNFAVVSTVVGISPYSSASRRAASSVNPSWVACLMNSSRAIWVFSRNSPADAPPSRAASIQSHPASAVLMSWSLASRPASV